MWACQREWAVGRVWTLISSYPLVVRWLAVLVLIVAPSMALAKPKVAVTPVIGDSASNQVAALLEELLQETASVVTHGRTETAMEKLGLSGELDEKDARKLTKKLGVVALVQGKLGKDGRKRTLHLTISSRTKKPTGFTVEYTTASDKFKQKVRDELVERIGTDEELDPDDDGETKPKKRITDDDPETKPKKRVADDDGTKIKKRNDDEPKKKKRKRRDDDDPAEDEPRTAVGARVDAGMTFGVRRLTYKQSGPGGPPPVGTRAPSARFEGEVYPFALANPKSGAAGFGLAAEYDKTFALSIAVPGTGLKTPINQAHYSIGLRYQIAVGAGSSIGLGLDYARRHYIADRKGLMNPQQLDAPDVNYSAIEPGVVLRTPVASSVNLFVDAGVMLILNTGAIQKADSYGPATVFGGELNAGIDIGLTKQIALRLALEYSQINFKFKGTGDMAANRGVTAATDRSIGFGTMLAVTY